MSHNTPTTYLQRFGDAMALLCCTRPEDSMLQAWIDGTSEALQEFAIEFGPEWAQGIAVIDAARVVADQPTEGVDHEFLPEVEPASALLEMMLTWVPAEFHQRVRHMLASIAKPADSDSGVVYADLDTFDAWLRKHPGRRFMTPTDAETLDGFCFACIAELRKVRAGLANQPAGAT